VKNRCYQYEGAAYRCRLGPWNCDKSQLLVIWPTNIFMVF
jgi:hypothetical protein